VLRVTLKNVKKMERRRRSLNTPRDRKISNTKKGEKKERGGSFFGWRGKKRGEFVKPSRRREGEAKPYAAPTCQ